LPERRLTCPKCGGQFEYQFVWGASLTAVRLGTSRYMRCPLCQKWALFRLLGPESVVLARPPTSGGAARGEPVRPAIAPAMAPSYPLREAGPIPPRRYSDMKVTILGGGILGAIVVSSVILSYLLPWPEPRLAAVIAGAGAVVVVALVFFVFFRIRERPRPSS